MRVMKLSSPKTGHSIDAELSQPIAAQLHQSFGLLLTTSNVTNVILSDGPLKIMSQAFKLTICDPALKKPLTLLEIINIMAPSQAY
jgi:hypothetical protein